MALRSFKMDHTGIYDSNRLFVFKSKDVVRVTRLHVCLFGDHVARSFYSLGDDFVLFGCASRIKNLGAQEVVDNLVY